jgi:hypothetical protein
MEMVACSSVKENENENENYYSETKKDDEGTTVAYALAWESESFEV